MVSIVMISIYKGDALSIFPALMGSVWIKWVGWGKMNKAEVKWVVLENSKLGTDKSKVITVKESSLRSSC